VRRLFAVTGLDRIFRVVRASCDLVGLDHRRLGQHFHHFGVRFAGRSGKPARAVWRKCIAGKHARR
jgi:hypothetical protein